MLCLLETPVVQVFDNEQTHDDFHGCRVTTTPERAGMSPRQVCLNLAEEEIIIEESIQMSEHRIGLGCYLGNSSKHIFFSIAVNKHLALLLYLDFLGGLALCLRFAASFGWAVDT